MVFVLPCILTAQEDKTKRPRDRYQKPVPVNSERAKEVISAIEAYRKILASKDYKKFYQECVHTTLKKRATEDRFSKQIASAATFLEQFFKDVLTNFKVKGHKDSDFQIGEMPQPRVKGTLIIQFADRIDAEPRVQWPKAKPLRIQIAPDGDALRFYDID